MFFIVVKLSELDLRIETNSLQAVSDIIFVLHPLMKEFLSTMFFFSFPGYLAWKGGLMILWKLLKQWTGLNTVEFKKKQQHKEMKGNITLF